MVAQKNRLAEAALPTNHNTRLGIASVLVNVKGAKKSRLNTAALSGTISVCLVC